MSDPINITLIKKTPIDATLVKKVINAINQGRGLRGWWSAIHVDDGYIQAKYEYQSEWTNLVPLSDLVGPGGVTFTPHISEDGVLSWTNNGELENPDPINLTGSGSGSSFATYSHQQIEPSDIWIINHNLYCYPAVAIVSSSGETVEGAVEYVSNTQLKIYFKAPFGGDAYLN